MVDFILSRMNAFQRLSDREPSNFTAAEVVRLCADLLFRLQVPFFKQGKIWRIDKLYMGRKVDEAKRSC